jgi:hypothetical protein
MRLYTRCATPPDSLQMWLKCESMFGLILWLPEDTPAQKALKFAAVASYKYKARKGRHCTNLLSILSADLRDVGLGTLIPAKKLWELKTLARDKVQGIKMKKN